jgi:hypothetical protein
MGLMATLVGAMSGSTRSKEELDERIAAVIAQASVTPDMAALVEQARTLDERLSELHAALALTRSVTGYELARELAVERDAICAVIGLSVARSGRTLDGPSDDARTSDAGERATLVDAARDIAPELVPIDAPAQAQPASAEEVSSFVARISKSGLGTGAALAVAAPTWPALLDDLLTRMGAPPVDETAVAIEDEVELLFAATTREQIESWTQLPPDLQQAFVSMLVARLSRLRDSRLLSELQAARLREVVSRLQTYTRTHRTGHINGLALRHRPVAPTWGEDALHYWDELQGRLDLPAHAEPTTRRKAPRETGDVEERVSIPEAWPHRVMLEGKSAVLIGGEPREVNRARLERTLGLRKLEWISSKNPRRHDAIVDAVAAGGVDLVFIVKNLISHSILEKIVAACDEAHVGWALLDGYGSAAFIRGVERYLARRSVA